MIETARNLVGQIHERIQNANIINLAELPSRYDPSGEHQLERIVVENTQGVTAELGARVKSEFLGAGPLQSLLEDPDVTEIIINGPSAIGFEKGGQIERWSDCFLSDITYRNFVVRLCRECEIQVTVDHPFANGRWGDFRVHVASPPCSPQGVVIALRRIARKPWSFEQLMNLGWASAEVCAQLKRYVEERCNVLVVGGTGCGKTAVLSAYLSAVPEKQRVICIEDTDELGHNPWLATQLLTRQDPQQILRDVDQAELVRQALRMRPDRLVMGEVRGPEAKDLLMAWSTGHRGSWSSLHADSAHQALIRLEMLVQMGAPQWRSDAVRRLIQLSLHYVVVVERESSGKRVLKSIERVSSLEDHGFLIEPVYVRP